MWWGIKDIKERGGGKPSKIFNFKILLTKK